MKKLKLIILSCTIAISLFASCKPSTSASAPQSSSTLQSSSTPVSSTGSSVPQSSSISVSSAAASSSSASEIKLPGIKGSFAHDITIGLESNGIPKAETETISDGFQYNSNNEQYSYSITANEEHEIGAATFIVLSGDGKEYLSFCASLPYDSADTEKAAQWVKDNIGTEAEITIGDAIFILSNGKQGAVLEIKCTGFDDYLFSKV